MALFKRAVFLSCLLGLSHARCFFPNGTQNPEPYHNRCSNDPSSPIFNVCCAIDRLNPSGGNSTGGDWTTDICLPSGVCENRYVNEDGPGTTYWREECTESDWTKGNCPNFCLQGESSKGTQRITPCDGTSTSEFWCCGDDTSCCDTVAAVRISATLSASVTTKSSTSSSTSPPSSSSSSNTQQTNPPPDPSSSSPAAPSSSGLSAGAKAGIAIGAIAGVAAVFAAGFLLARRRLTRSKNPAELYSEHQTPSYNNDAAVKYHMVAGPGPEEMNGETRPQEISTERPPQELPAEPR